MTSKTKVHTVYKTSDGIRVPGVTTVIIADKSNLIHWAWEQGVNGNDYRKVRDQAGDIGTLTHYRIMCEFTGETPDLTDYSKRDIDKSDNAMLKFYEWQGQHSIIPFKPYIEKPMVSDNLKYGGTPDLPCIYDDVTTLVDVKTGKGIYDEYLFQIAAYRYLLSEHDIHIEQGLILNIGKGETLDFEARIINKKQLDISWQIFKHMLGIYYDKKQLKGEK